MHVLMLSELYPPFIGGSEEYVRNLSRELVARGHHVEVATMAAPDEAPSVVDEDGVRVHRLRGSVARLGTPPSGRPYSPPAPDPEVTLALRRIVSERPPDVVHAHNWMVASYLPLKATTEAALVMTLHDYLLVCAKRNLLFRDRECSGPGFEKCLRCAARHYGDVRGPAITLANWALEPLLRRAVDAWLPVSGFVAQANRLDGTDARHEVVPNFVPDDVMAGAAPDHPALAALPRRRYWLFVGALSRHKGIQTLLNAYREIPSAPPLVVVGRRHPEEPSQYPAGVTVLHDLDHDAVMAAWQRARIGIVPSLFPDPCPSVAIEAMAAGVPLIASRNGGLTDLVEDGRSGLLVAPGDAGALRDALCRLLDDDAERGRMATAARRRASQFMASGVVPRIESIYSQAIAERGR